MTTLKPYSAYKESGVDWLAEMPAHWNVRRLKTVSNLKAGEGITSEEIEPKGLFPVFGGNGLRGYSDRFTHEGFHALIGRQGALCGNVHFVEGRFWASEHAIVATPLAETDARWLGRVLRTMNLGQYSMSAAQPGIGVESIKDLALPLPPLDEQRAIADFLDGMDARITRFIAARRKMIALLEEKKQAVINQAVTRGLDPDVPMKDSGVDWLGDIPAHWEIRRGAALFTERNDTGYPDLPILEVSLNTGVTVRDLSDPRRKQMMSDRSGYKRAMSGDLPYNMMRMWQGAIGVAPVDGLVSPAYVVLKPKPTSISAYYAHLFRTPFFKKEVSGRSRGIVSDRDRLYWDAFRQIQMPCLSTNEQQAIVEFIDCETSRIDTLISHHHRELELMREYRTRLISDVVTGKLDVRGVELPEVEEVIGEEIEATLMDEAVLVEEF